MPLIHVLDDVKMKKIIYLICIFVIVVIVLITTYYVKNNKKIVFYESPLKEFTFQYNEGNSSESYIYYQLKKENNNWIILFESDYGKDDVQKIQVDEEIINKIDSILKKYNIYKWNKFNKTDKHILDGDSFSLYVKKENNMSISASGYEKWPQNYKEAKLEIDNLFKSYK